MSAIGKANNALVIMFLLGIGGCYSVMQDAMKGRLHIGRFLISILLWISLKVFYAIGNATTRIFK